MLAAPPDVRDKILRAAAKAAARYYEPGKNVPRDDWRPSIAQRLRTIWYTIREEFQL